MIKLTKSQQAWRSTDFKKILKSEIQSIDANLLPLQQGLSYSSYVSNSDFSITILNVTETVDVILVKVGVFYNGIIAGCSCSDDPTPVDDQNEYCELQFDINLNTAETTVRLLNTEV